MPFPFYNTASPTPSTKNSITKTATDFGYRDFLLLKNLAPVYPSALNNSPATVRIGEPVLDTSINGDTNVIPFGLPLETEGLFRYDIAILPNKFKNDDPTAPSLIEVEDIPQTQGIFGNIDFPQGTQSYPTSATQQITELGLFGKTNYAEFRKQNTLYNLYLDTTQQTDVSDWISLQPIGVAQQINGYLNEYGALNLGNGQSSQIADIIGSVLNGQGIGFSNTGIITNYDIRSSLAGRILGATGTINDTRLGSIGAQQLALALANNAAFNVQEEILGSLNVRDNILSLVKDGTTVGFRPNYQITVPSGGLGRVADYTARILGFTLPKSYLSDAGSIFQSESGGNIDNITRANSMLLNTGKGQVKALISNVYSNLIGTGQYDNPSTTAFRSGYAPGYKNNRGNATDINPNIYAFYNSSGNTINFFASDDNTIPNISYNRSKLISDYGFQSPEENKDGFIAGQPNTTSTYNNRKISDISFSWGSYLGGNVNSNGDYASINGDKKSLLVKTQKLFNSKGMKNIVSVKGDMNNNSSQITTANGGGFSKGSAVLSAGNYDANGIYSGTKDGTADQVYCRSWTTLDRYDTVFKMVRHSGLTETSQRFGENYFRFQTEGSTLEKYGFPKIAPYTDDKYFDNIQGTTKVDPKAYMFSIENLAWADTWQNLPPVEVGNGDLGTGKRGRIMWFPPYNIQFNETSTAEWETTKFIGRGEPVYTYNNTERSGSLSFSIIVDHSSYMNTFRGSNGPDDNYVASFIAGCVDPTSDFAKRLTIKEVSDLVQTQIEEVQKATITPETAPPPFTIYFPNDEDDINAIFGSGYENGKMIGTLTPTQDIDYSTNPSGSGYGIGSYQGNVTSSTPWNDTTNFGKNGLPGGLIDLDGIGTFVNWTDPNFLPSLDVYLQKNCPSCVINIQSYASAQGNETANEKLSTGRTKSVYDYLFANLYSGKNNDYKKARIKPNYVYKPITSKCNKTPGSATDTEACKIDRKTTITFSVDSGLQAQNVAKPKPVIKKTEQQNVRSEIKSRFYDESKYFDRLVETDEFVFDRFRDKIKYFHPAFHSMTPEGLNSRLTFLHQCTRQGPTIADVSGENKAVNANLAFGRPPICILRLGDFYYSRIIIDNVTIDYEPLVWDLNPEGVGVQPMIANVTLSIKFIGGSSLLGPINKLQNALSFNYYANTHVYDPRADYKKFQSDTTNSQNTNVGSEVIIIGSPSWKIVDGVKSIYNDNYTKTEIAREAVKPEVNQEEDCNDANGPTATPPANQPPSIGTTEPEITGMFLNIAKLNDVEGFWTIGLHLDAIGVNSDNDKEILIKKGIQIRIDNQLGFYYEQKISNIEYFGISVLGDTTSGISKTKLANGIYSASLFVGGIRITSQNLSLQ